MREQAIAEYDKWLNRRTLDELGRLRAFVQSHSDIRVRKFLTACFSAIIPMCTARRGEQHGYFADNAPLPKGQLKPPYQDAAKMFVARVKRNVDLVEGLYAFIERDGRDPATELGRVRVVQLDARTAEPSAYGVEDHSVAGIITSPPYLCMSDYALGQRLSYYWISPDGLKEDFEREIGARRQRFKPEQAVQSYFTGLREFAGRAVKLLRPGGFMATLLSLHGRRRP